MSAVYNSTVQGFYLSYYGRPADPAGLTFWTGQLAAAGGNLSSILNAFGTSAEATRRYGTGTDDSKIEAIYQQTFGRAADPTGLAFYKGELAAGRITLIDISKRVIDGATGDDVTIRTNRLSAAQTFTDKLDTDSEKAGYSGAGAEDAARAWVATVTKDPATVTAAAATADSTITNLLPQTFTLTINQDKWTGSAGNDTVAGGINSLASTDTLGVTDQIDGGAGTDTLNLSVSKNFVGFTTGSGFLKNVETVNFTNNSVNAYSFAAKGVTGVTTYNVTGEVDLSSLDSLTTGVNFSTVPNAASLSVAFNDEAVTGSSDAIKIGVSALGTVQSGSSPLLSGSTAPTLTTAGIETLTLNASGTNFVELASAGVSTLKITGSGTVGLKEVGSGLKSIDASAATGSIEAKLNNASGITSVQTGSGNDILRMVNGDLSGTATVSLGTGTNKIVYEGTTSADIVNQFTVSGLSQVDIGGSLAHSVTFSAKNATGFNTAYITRSAPSSTVTNNEGTATSTNTAPTTSVYSSFTDLGSTDFVINVQADRSSDTAANHAVVADTTGSVTVNFQTSSSAVSSASAETSRDNIFLTKAGAVTVNVPSFLQVVGAAGANSTGTVFANDATQITVTGSGDFDGRIAGGKLKTITLNQTGGADSWSTDIRAAGTNGAQATSTVETLNITAAKNISVSTAQPLVALQTLNITNAGTVSGIDDTDLDAISNISTTGASSTSAISLPGIGATTLAYGINVTSSGQKAGFNLGRIDVGPSQAVVINVSGNDGTTAIGGTGSNVVVTDVGVVVADSGSSKSGSITLNAVGHGDGLSADGTASATDSITVGTLTAATVTIDLSGAVNTSAIGVITGTNVSVNAATAQDTVTIGDGAATAAADIVATRSITYSGPLTKSTDIDATISGTTFTGTLNGGILADTFDFTSTGFSQSSITLTGDLGSGTDRVSVSSMSSSVAQTIDISGLLSYDSAEIRGAANAKNVITGGAGNDTIYGGMRADTINLGTGSDRVFLNSKTDTGTVTVSSLLTNSVFVSQKSVSTVDLDVITGFGASDVLTISGFNVQAITTANRVTYGTTNTTAMDSEGRLLNGTYNSGANTFTTSNTGTDTLYLYDSTTTARGIVLVGFGTGFGDNGATTTGLSGSTS